MKRVNKYPRLGVVLVTMLVVVQFLSLAYAAPKNVFTRRYLGLNFDMLDRGTVNDKLYGRVDRAADAGYNGILLREWYHDLDKKSYRRKGIEPLKKLKAYTEKKGLAVIPWCYYQGEVADEDSTLAEAFPVRGTRFQVAAGEARVASDHSVTINNGGFDSYSGNKPNGWGIKGLAHGVELFMDTKTKYSGSASLRVQNPQGYAQISQAVTGLKPFRAYQLSVYIKTEGYKAAKVLGFTVTATGYRSLLNRRSAGFGLWGASPNAGSFRKYQIDFNSLEYSTATLGFVFSKGAATGKVWVDGMKICEVGLYETIRRESCPVKVSSEDGSITYEEGKDYTVKPGHVLYTGSNDGQALIIPSGSRIKNGQYLRVDWFQHANVECTKSSTSFCSQKAFDMTRENIQAVDALFDNPQASYLFLDEWRDAGWDPACSRFPNAGEYMGWATAETEKLLKANNPNREIYVPNDMYDPYHCASKTYYMTRNGTYGSWKALSHDMVMLNWNGGSRNVKSLKFFAGKDPDHPEVYNRQVLSVSYAPSQALKWENALVEAEKDGITGVIGVAYVTWSYDFRGIEPTADVFKKSGRWLKGPVDWKTSVRKPAVAKAGALKASVGNGRIHYTLAQNCNVQLKITDALGRALRLPVDRLQSAGTHTVDLNSLQLPSGVYFAEFSAGEKGALGSYTQKLVLF